MKISSSIYIKSLIILLIILVETECTSRLIEDTLWDFDVRSDRDFLNIYSPERDLNDLYIYETLENEEKKLIYYNNVDNQHSIFKDDFGQYIDDKNSNLSYVMFKNPENISKTYPISVSVVDQESFAIEKDYSFKYDRIHHVIIIKEKDQEPAAIPDVVGTRQEFWSFIVLAVVLIIFLVLFKKNFYINLKIRCFEGEKKEAKIYKNVKMSAIPNGNSEKTYTQDIIPKLNISHGI